MKKMLLSCICLACGVLAHAQTPVYAPRWQDNWSLTLAGGVTHPANYLPKSKLASPSVHLGLTKSFTPSFGLGVELDYLHGNENLYANTDNRSALSVVGQTNWTNLISGYYGRPRLFEFTTHLGVGWGHTFSRRADENYVVSKFGAAVLLNVGSARAWTIGLRPSLIYDLRSSDVKNHAQYNLNRAIFQLTLGLTYHFGNGHAGHRSAPVVNVTSSQSVAQKRPRNEWEIENARLRNERDAAQNAVQNLQSAMAAQLSRINQLEKRLQELGVRTPVAPLPTTVVTTSRRVLESVITFGVGRATIDASQYPNVERIATYLRRYARARVVVKGYASPDGNAEVNARVARQRAEVVKSLLIAQYRIEAHRIEAMGEGVGNLFDDPDWNRVSICTIVE